MFYQYAWIEPLFYSQQNSKWLTGIQCCFKIQKMPLAVGQKSVEGRTQKLFGLISQLTSTKNLSVVEIPQAVADWLPTVCLPRPSRNPLLAQLSCFSCL